MIYCVRPLLTIIIGMPVSLHLLWYRKLSLREECNKSYTSRFRPSLRKPHRDDFHSLSTPTAANFFTPVSFP